MLFKIGVLIYGYFAGALIQAGYWMGKFNKIDIRDYGSGNAGTTNVMRTLGKKAGIATYLLDAFKAVIADILIHFLIVPHTAIPEMLLFLYCGLGIVLGHNFPFYLHFKGGKGIAVSAAVIVVSNLHPVFIGVGLAVFILVVAVTRYVSLGSLIVVWYIPIFTLLYYRESDLFPVILIVSLLFTILAYIKHKANIIRLIHGTENKFGEKKEKKSEEN